MIKVIHNPRCSKSRKTLELLEEKQLSFDTIDYLQGELTLKVLQDIVKKLGIPAHEMLRKKEDIFQSIELDLNNDQAVLETILKHPILLERPIVFSEEKAVIARPPENVFDIL